MTSFKKQPLMNATEDMGLIEEMTEISRSLSQIRAFMKRHRLRYIKTGYVPAEVDEEKQRKWVKDTLDPAIE